MTERPIQVNQTYYNDYLTKLDKENEEKGTKEGEENFRIEKFGEKYSEEDMKGIISPWWPKREKPSRVFSWFSKAPEELPPENKFKEIEFEDKETFWVPMRKLNEDRKGKNGEDVWENRGMVRI